MWESSHCESPWETSWFCSLIPTHWIRRVEEQVYVVLKHTSCKVMWTHPTTLNLHLLIYKGCLLRSATKLQARGTMKVNFFWRPLVGFRIYISEDSHFPSPRLFLCWFVPSKVPPLSYVSMQVLCEHCWWLMVGSWHQSVLFSPSLHVLHHFPALITG